MTPVDPAQIKRASRVLWSTLLASQLVYLALILSGVARVREQPLELPALPIAFGVVAGATGIAAHPLWRRASGAGRALPADPPEAAAAFTFFLLAWVLDESIAVYGLLLALLAFSPVSWSPFSAAALALMLVHRPS
jgi:hypothetical protein